MEGSSITRRVRLSGVEPDDMSLRAELFRILADYGVLEEVCFEEDRAFHSGAAVLQFQLLSAAERLQADVSSTGRCWGLTFVPPVMHVGSELLLTSPDPLDLDRLRAMAGTATVSEKALAAPDALRDDAAAAESAGLDAENGSRGAFLRAMACVRQRAFGRHAAVLSFGAVPDAAAFLAAHQRTLAAASVFLAHIGPQTAALSVALREGLFTRRRAADVRGGAVLRGLVVRGAGGVSACAVDAGVVGEDGRPLLLQTRTNFARVGPWDTVEVRVGRCLPEAELVRVAVRKREAPTRAAHGVPFRPTPPPRRATAGRLFDALQKKRREMDGDGAAELRERWHPFPRGLHLFQTLHVCVERIGADGLHARALLPDKGETAPNDAPRDWPVFIPSAFMPRDANGDWRGFAVAGERMAVAVLYATAVGGSAATLRLIASKREAEMRRANDKPIDAVLESTRCVAEPLASGLVFSGSPVLLLRDTPGVEGAVCLVQPESPTAALATLSLVLSVPNEETVADGVWRSFAVAEVVRDERQGQFARIVEEAVYRQHEAERRRVQMKRESAKTDLVRRILAETLGNKGDATEADGASKTEEPGFKKPRTES